MDKLVVFCAQYLVVLAPLAVVVCWFLLDNKLRRVLFLRAICVGGFATAFAKIGGDLYFDKRPFVVMHVKPLIDHIADNGFPSDHTLVAFGCAFLIWPFSRPLSVFAGVVGLLVAWARVVSLLHSPLDIAGSIVFAVLATLLAKILVRRVEPGRRHPTGRVPGAPADPIRRPKTSSATKSL